MIKLIDFYAEWCGPCHAIKPVLDKLEKEYEGKVEIERVDVDQSQPIAQKYGIMSIPTLVLEKDGKELDRRVGALPEDILKSWLDSNI